jgi:cAMP-binding proteins - catabolite gene activator and regulatory subunit of cAMP-dependent protein kinases
MPDAMQASFDGQPPRSDLRSAAMQQQLQHGGTLVELANHAPVYAQGDPARHIYQVEEGCVCICNYEEEGRRLIHAFHFAGDVFGFEANDHHMNSAEAICPARLLCCEVRKLTQAWGENPSGALAFWQWRSAQQDRMLERLSHIAHLDGIGRVLFFLADLARRTGPSRRIELSMSRYDIADYLGLSSETVSRIFTRLKRRGMIAIIGHCITIKADWTLAILSANGPLAWQQLDDERRTSSAVA